MAFKFVFLVACVATVNAGTGFILPGQITIAKIIPFQYVAHSGQSLPSHYIPLSGNPTRRDQTIIYQAGHGSTFKNNDEYDSHPQYIYGYNVQDSISGDSKSQVETRDGDKVNGHYSLVDADGFKRIVQYTSDSINGFNAVVTRVPIQGLNNVNSLVSVPEKANESRKELPYVSASAQEIDFDPVVKGAYAVSPIVRAVPVAYPISKGHHK